MYILYTRGKLRIYCTYINMSGCLPDAAQCFHSYTASQQQSTEFNAINTSSETQHAKLNGCFLASSGLHILRNIRVQSTLFSGRKRQEKVASLSLCSPAFLQLTFKSNILISCIVLVHCARNRRTWPRDIFRCCEWFASLSCKLCISFWLRWKTK